MLELMSWANKGRTLFVPDYPAVEKGTTTLMI